MLKKVKTDVQEHTAKVLQEIDLHLRDALSNEPDWAKDLKSDLPSDIKSVLSFDEEFEIISDQVGNLKRDLKESQAQTFSKLSEYEGSWGKVTATIHDSEGNTKRLLQEGFATTGYLIQDLSSSAVDKITFNSRQDILQQKIEDFVTHVENFKADFKKIEGSLDSQEEARKKSKDVDRWNEEKTNQLLLEAISRAERSIQNLSSDATGTLKSLASEQNALKQTVAILTADAGTFNKRFDSLEKCINQQKESLEALNDKQNLLITMLARQCKPWYKRMFRNSEKDLSHEEVTIK